jgi:hypothetical protein
LERIMPLSAISNDDGRIEIFARAGDSTIWHNWQVVADTDQWNGWQQIPGPQMAGTPTVGRNADGRLEMFISDQHGAAWHSWQQNAGINNWVALQALPAGPGPSLAPSSPIPAQLNTGGALNGALQVFGRDTQAGIWTNWQTSPGAGWAGWELIGEASENGAFGLSAPPCVTTFPDGTMVAIALSGTNSMVSTQQTAPGDNSSWSDWQQLTTSNPAFKPGTSACVGSDTDGHLELFAIDQSGSCWAIAQTSAGSTEPWSQWQDLGTPGTATTLAVTPCVEAYEDGRLVLVCKGSDDFAYYLAQPTAGDWSGATWNFTARGLGAGAPTTARNLDCRLECFAINTALGSTGNCWEAFETSPGAWNGASNLGSPPHGLFP